MMARGYKSEDSEVIASAVLRKRGDYRQYYADITYDNEYLWPHYNNDEYPLEDELEGFQIIEVTNTD